MKKWYYYTGVINSGSIVKDEPVGVFEGEGQFDEKGRFWTNKGNGQYRDYHNCYDTREEALVAYHEQVLGIEQMYNSHIQELYHAVEG